MDRYFHVYAYNIVFLAGLSIGLLYAPYFGGEVTIYKQDRLSLPCPQGGE